MKKTLALALVVMMFCLCAFTVSAAETTLPDSDGTAWWVNHTEGVEVTAEGITVTCTNTTYETAVENWNGPLWVLYTGDEAKVNGAGYVEYWVQRGDNYGWCVVGQYYNVDLNRWSDAAALAEKGIYVTDAFADGFDWANFQTALKAGAEVKITAKLEGSNVIITTEVAGVTNTTTLPVDTSKPVYLSLFADQAKLTNIKVTTPDPSVPVNPSLPGTGDAFSIAIALMGISSLALVALKKKEN